MSGTAQVQISLKVKSGNVDEQTRPNVFTATVAGTNGPTPGSFSVSVHGTDVNFSGLTSYGGFCWIQNQDSTNYVEWGVWDTLTLVFYPIGKLLPGEMTAFRLSSNLSKDEAGTGTGPATGTTTMRFKANTAACQVCVKAFDP